MSEQTDQRSIGKRANELNASIRYTMWSVFRLTRPLGDEQRTAVADATAGPGMGRGPAPLSPQ